MQSPQKIFAHYKEKRLTLTPERKLIIELLQEDTSHPCMDEIHQRAKVQMPDISRTIVFNTVTELELFGEIKKLDFITGNSSRYDTNIMPHSHLYCTRCHRVFDIEIGLDAFIIDPEKFSGFDIEAAQVIFYGVCPDCQET